MKVNLFFRQVTPLVEKGLTKNLEAEDLFDLPAVLSPSVVSVDESKVNWSHWRKLLLSLYWQAFRFWLPAFALIVASALLNALSPILVHEFIAHLQLGAQPLWLTLIYAVSIGLAGLGSGLALQHYFARNLTLFQVATNAINRKLFQHSLRLHKGERDLLPVGEIVNHMSSDAEAVASFGATTCDIAYSLVSILGFVILLFFYLGHTAWVGIAALVTLIPLTKKASRRFTDIEDQLMKRRDERVTLMSQILTSIRVVKYFVWERPMTREVQKLRHEELRVRGELAATEMGATLVFVGVGTLVLFLVLLVHGLTGHPLDAAIAFTLVSLFRIVDEPFSSLSRYVSNLANARVGAKRIAEFLSRLERNENQIEQLSGAGPFALEIENLSVHYGEARILDNISLQVRQGENLAVVGAVGAGKSTLLNALLGEVEFSGRIARLAKTWAYVPQEAYIINSTVRENLAFGRHDIPPEEWNEAIFAACLEEDIRALPAGFETEIGERGINLSGGQKQRFSLARSILHKPDLLLLDDPLSAVDSKVEDLLFERLWQGVWRDKTRVTITHRLEHLEEFDRIVFLEGGRIVGLGTFDELVSGCLQFQEFLHEHHQATHNEAAKQEETAFAAAQIQPVETTGRLTDDEDRQIGAVSGSVYGDYVSALGGRNPRRRPLVIAALFGAAALATSLPLLQRSWLAWMSNAQRGVAVPFLKGILASPGWSMVIYGLLGVVTLAGVLASDLFWLRRGLRAARDMHDQMLTSVLRAQVRFFDATPVGRILQRFSRDLEMVDIDLQWTFEKSVQHFFQVLANLLLIVAVLPPVILFIAPVFYVYYQVQKKYRTSARELKRLDSISRSPRYAHFKETIQGLVVLRSLHKEDWFYQQFIDRLAFNQRMFFGHYMVNRWFSSRIPLVGAMVAAATTLVITGLVSQGRLSPGVAGLLTVSSLGFWGVLNMGIRIWAEVEARMTSVERIRSFIKAPQEARQPLPLTLSGRPNWPEHGEIEFQDVVARYAEHLPPVLKGLSFRVEAGSRVGLIGRTGSGKSTIFQTLFRFLEPETGKILIDGVDIATVPLEHLRRSIAVIPQDPILFLGSIRSNLDRFNELDEGEIWSVLEKVRLADFVRTLPEGLDSEVVENGGNLSQGQRQLLCLARALLVDAKIIILDEATASVDVRTDKLVQEVIRESCQGMTMMIIAHRLGTVRDCEQIFELLEGRLRRHLRLGASRVVNEQASEPLPEKPLQAQVPAAPPPSEPEQLMLPFGNFDAQM